eukprot:scaffold16_cov147-Skeletonema_menzelii.AAC.8
MESSGTKRRRRLGASDSSTICLSDLNSGILGNIANYLALPSRALFAVALNCRDVERCSAISGDQGDVLDFGDIEKELAAKLSDNDVNGALLSIDAVNNLKTLRLTNLLNISGIGLEPLRGSTIIEKIDLSLVGDHEIPKLCPEPPISCTDILPILDSIIDMGEASSLKLLIFPKKWREERNNTESDFHAFLTRYNELLCSRADTCLKCSCNLSDNADNPMLHITASDERYGAQKYNCYSCMKQYCFECEDDGANFMTHRCGKCERLYCLHCKTLTWCKCCDDMMCVDCMDFRVCSSCEVDTCRDCVSERSCENNCGVDKIWCESCVDDEDAMRRCGICGVDYCNSCCDSYVHTVKFCVVCNTSICGQCVVKKCEKERQCIGCYRLSFPVLLEEKERLRAKARNELNELKSRIDYLDARLEEIQKQKGR